MASAVNELGQLLRGGEAPADANQQADGAGGSVQPGAAAAAAGKAGATGVDISKLSQLSDFADKELQRDQKPAHFSQESLIEPPPNPLTFQQASQPADIPAPLLPESQNMSTLPPGATPASAAAAAAAEEQQKQMAAAAAAAVGGVLPMEQMMALMPGMLGMDWAQMAVRARLASQPACLPARPPTLPALPACSRACFPCRPACKVAAGPTACSCCASHALAHLANLAPSAFRPLLPPSALLLPCRCPTPWRQMCRSSPGRAARAGSPRGAGPWTRCDSSCAYWSRCAALSWRPTALTWQGDARPCREREAGALSATPLLGPEAVRRSTAKGDEPRLLSPF